MKWRGCVLPRNTCPTQCLRCWGEDETDRAFATADLEPQAHPVWKSQLQAGLVHLGTAERSGAVFGHMACGQCRPSRFKPTLLTTMPISSPFDYTPTSNATALRHPHCADVICTACVQQTLSHKHALVHGDVSPENIWRSSWPRFLDAECAWDGNPAFDLAFVLNHLLLKCLWKPVHHLAYLAESFDALSHTYSGGSQLGKTQPP
jgi:hypothetical protein